MKVFITLEAVDLGYAVLDVYSTEEKAEKALAEYRQGAYDYFYKHCFVPEGESRKEHAKIHAETHYAIVEKEIL